MAYSNVLLVTLALSTNNYSIHSISDLTIRFNTQLETPASIEPVPPKSQFSLFSNKIHYQPQYPSSTITFNYLHPQFT